MFYRLLMIFILVPLLELFILIKVGKYMGTLNTIGLIILTGIIGASFAKQQGAGILASIRQSMQQGQVPGDAMLQGLMVLIGGILLITPGFITDLVGFSLIIPFTRQFYSGLVLGFLKQRFQKSGFYAASDFSQPESHDNDSDQLEIK